MCVNRAIVPDPVDDFARKSLVVFFFLLKREIVDLEER